MKKTLLSLLIAAGFASSAQLSIENTDLKWTIGNQWYNTVHTVNIASIDVTAGTGKTWDFSTYTSTASKDTVRVTAGATEDLDITSTQLKQNTFNAVGADYHQKMAGGFNLDAAVSIGLPHTQGKNWAESISALGGFMSGTITGDVLGEGTIKLPWGDVTAVLVRERIQASGFTTVDETYYWWETEKYGRVATLVSGTKLSIMTQNNFDPVIITSVGAPVAQNQLKVFPNPAVNNLTVNFTKDVKTVQVFDLLGNKVIDQAVTGTQAQVSLQNLATGRYIVKAVANNKIYTASVVKK